MDQPSFSLWPAATASSI